MSFRQLSEDEIKTMLAQMQPAEEDVAAGAEVSPQTADAEPETTHQQSTPPAKAEPTTKDAAAAAAAESPQTADAEPESTHEQSTPPAKAEPTTKDAAAAAAAESPQTADAEPESTIDRDTPPAEAEDSSANSPNETSETSPAERQGERDAGPAPKPRFRWRYLATAGVVAGLIACGAGWTLLRADRRMPPAEPEATSTAPATEAEFQTGAATEAPQVSDPLNQTFQSQLEQLTALREELLIRAGNIVEIQGGYRSAIERVLDEILEEKRRNAIHGLPRALENPALALRLATIQRRQAYIQSLEAPVAELKNSAEDLLYLQRKSEIQQLIVDACTDLSLSRLIEQNRRILSEYRDLPQQLHVDLNSVRRRPLEEIWKMVEEREKQYALRSYPGSLEPSPSAAPEQDRQIWQELCNGQFSRKSQLGALSAEAAACLARTDEPDLFLNRLTQLEPDAARGLLQWKGKWLCMNGLRELKPEVARALFAWEGHWISLNGLEVLPFDASMYLSRWEGHTLELMGLSAQRMKQDPLAVRHLRLWEAEGGKLFVTEEVRRLMKDFS